MALESARAYVQKRVEVLGQTIVTCFSLLKSHSGKTIKHPLRFLIECPKSHQNVRSYSSIVQDAQCRDCSPNRYNKPIELEDVIAVIKNRGWEFVGIVNSTKNNKRRFSKKMVSVKCDKGHPFDMRYEYIKDGFQCRECFGRSPWTMPKLQAQIAPRRMKCISPPSQLKNNKSLLDFLCERCGATWDAPIVNIIYRKSGCPECRYKGQRMVREILNLVFWPYGADFKTGRILGSVNPETRYPFQYDMISRLLMWVVEYDGEHHRGPVAIWGIGEAEYLEIRRRDLLKDDDAVKAGFTMVRIPSIRKDGFTEDDMLAYIAPIILRQLKKSRSPLYKLAKVRFALSFSELLQVKLELDGGKVSKETGKASVEEASALCQ